MKDKSKRKKVFSGFSLRPDLARWVADKAKKDRRSKTVVVEMALDDAKGRES